MLFDGTTLPPMPTSSTDYLTLTSGQTTAPAGKWCGIKNGITTAHCSRTHASSNITVNLVTLKNNGTLRRTYLTITNDNRWVTTSINTTDAIGVICYYDGSLGSGNQIHIYFD